MSQKTEQLLFCVYCVVFIIIALFTELDFLIFGFPGLLLLLFWISRLMKLARENKSQFMKKLPKWKAFLIIASALIAAFAMVYEAYIRMVNA